jgi:hypothetical protein
LKEHVDQVELPLRPFDDVVGGFRRRQRRRRSFVGVLVLGLVGAVAGLGIASLSGNGSRGVHSVAPGSPATRAADSGTTATTPAATGAGYPAHLVALTTTGEVIALSSVDGQRTATLFTVHQPPVGGVEAAVTGDNARAYISETTAADCGEIYDVPVDGSSPPRNLNVDGRSPTVTRDGRKLAYVSVKRVDDALSCPTQGVVIRDLATGQETAWTAADAAMAARGVYALEWSADGRYLALVLGGESCCEVRLLDTSRPGTVASSQRIDVPSNGERWSHPRYVGDGVAVQVNCCAPVFESPSSLVLIPTKGPARTLLKFAGPVSDSDFAPAGDYVAWVKDGELWRAKRDGSDPFKLAVGVEFARW